MTSLLDVIQVSTWLHFSFQNSPKSSLGGVLGASWGVLEAYWDVLWRLGDVLERLGTLNTDC